MRGFVKLADGVDVAPLVMALQRQGSVFEGQQVVALFAEGWQGAYYAFPQVRTLLLDVMRRVECGQLINVSLLLVNDTSLPPVEDASLARVLLALDAVKCASGDELWELAPGSVLFSAGAEELLLRGADAGMLCITFAPMP